MRFRRSASLSPELTTHRNSDRLKITTHRNSDSDGALRYRLNSRLTGIAIVILSERSQEIREILKRRAAIGTYI
ncbi:hypothetical protein MEO93_23510 [Dolichospermum sp. ST_sed3]|nr:hypothetical protein [Dolichospermum sp. ST_sed6]MDD1438553.1 hypothetical protein [Dolichospermum sp. ST_sed10]MDD1443269.1 hypothetical protein [Dolichospermum sp. ST_sed3]MDD1448934.1 hypothetical protein [Dolichospermum sp. ST_sed8]MDD1457525.1 hypothetical protein [Dolichospermum sp. ST_sed7]MDD1462957.1 hypothetical protein [Dolichospermum sp. ST_sed2]MDD1467919.1 hypothetical protein [Dolichospermum sp. ST_sed5]MDD1474134.1 hypothetical protein [Dolichospermum sp. ST_sed4]